MKRKWYLDEFGLKVNIIRMGKMTLEEVVSKPKPKVKAPLKRRGRAAPKLKVTKTETEKTVVAIVAGECSALLKQKGNVLRLKAHNFSMQRKCDQAEALLKEAAKLPVGHQEAVVHGLTEARHLFLEALMLISSDPVFSVLQDSSTYPHCHS
jgi:separase